MRTRNIRLLRQNINYLFQLVSMCICSHIKLTIMQGNIMLRETCTELVKWKSLNYQNLLNCSNELTHLNFFIKVGCKIAVSKPWQYCQNGCFFKSYINNKIQSEKGKKKVFNIFKSQSTFFGNYKSQIVFDMTIRKLMQRKIMTKIFKFT